MERSWRRLPAAILVAAGALAIALSFVSSPASAGGFHISIIGGRRNGMLTNLAAPDDLTALYHNPAGLADQPGYRFHLFGSANFVSNEFQLMALDPERFPAINPEGCGEEGADACPWPVGDDGYYEEPISPESSFGVLPFLGFGMDLGLLGSRFEDVVIAIGAYAPNLYGGSLPASAPTRYFMTDGYFATVAATIGMGWRINRYLSIGGNLSYNYMRMKFGFRLSMVDVLTDEGEEPGSIADVMQTAYGDIDMSYVGVDHGVGWSLGLLITPARWLAIGMAYQASSSARFEGDVTLRSMEPDTDLRDIEIFNYELPYGLEVEMAIPPSLAFGVNVTPREWIEVGLDLRLWLYNMYKHQTLRPLYRPDQDGVRPMTEESLSRDKDNSVSFELALGLLVRPVPRYRNLELMVGVGYDRSPVSDESFSLDNPAMSQFIASGGVRWRINEHVRLAAAYMFLYYLPRDITTSETSPPTNVKGAGFNHIPSLELEAAF